MGSVEDGKARRGFVDRLTYNYGNAEGGSPQQRDLSTFKVRKRRKGNWGWGDDFQPDVRSSDFQRLAWLARRAARPDPFNGRDRFDGDDEAKRLYVYFQSRRVACATESCNALARTIRRLGVDVGQVVRALVSQSDLGKYRLQA